MWRDRRRLWIAAFAAMSASIPAAGDERVHRAGFVVYARVDRPDDTYRIMLVSREAADDLHEARSAGQATILMESYAGGRLTSVFVKRRSADGWSYGAIRPGEGLDAVRPGSHCAACHRSASASDGMFTKDLLERFATSGEMQAAFCDRPGRSPCEPEAYAPVSRR